MCTLMQFTSSGLTEQIPYDENYIKIKQTVGRGLPPKDVYVTLIFELMTLNA